MVANQLDRLSRQRTDLSVKTSFESADWDVELLIEIIIVIAKQFNFTKARIQMQLARETYLAWHISQSD